MYLNESVRIITIEEKQKFPNNTIRENSIKFTYVPITFSKKYSSRATMHPSFSATAVISLCI